jgi:hypothetical protein
MSRGGEEMVPEIAAVELIEREFVEELAFGLRQELGPARDLPQFQTETQPVGFRTAFIALDFRGEHLRHAALPQHVAGVDHLLPSALGLFQILPVVGRTPERQHPRKEVR